MLSLSLLFFLVFFTVVLELYPPRSGKKDLINVLLFVFNPITINNFASLFNCTPVGRASDSMMAPT